MIFLNLVNLDDEVDLTNDVKFINDQLATSETELNKILEATTTTYDNRDANSEISLLPKCSCGYLHFRGAEMYVCPNCGSRPSSQVDAMVKSTLWFRKPEGFEKLINPAVFNMLQRRFTANGWDAIAWLTDPYYKSTNKVPTWLTSLQNQPFERGWNYYVKNFDAVMTYLFNQKIFKVEKGEVDYLFFLLQSQSDKVFCNYLPIPNKVMFPYEKTNFCIYRSTSATFASAFIQSMMSIDSPIQKLSMRSRESRMSRLYRNIAEYQNHHVKQELTPKEGVIRRNSLGTKTIMSGRGIIISKTGPQDHVEIGVPWFMALGAFRQIFINKLVRRGFTLNQAVNHIRMSTACYSPTLHDIMKEMLSEAPEGKMWCLYDRNPSLKHGSMQLGSVVFKIDPTDKCIDFPIPNVKSPNADFDGDQINIMFLIDGALIRYVTTFLPHTNVFELTRPFKMSNNVFVSAPQVSCYSNFLREARERKKPQGYIGLSA